MSVRSPLKAGGAALAAVLLACAPALAQDQDYEVDPEIRIQQLEQKLRVLTGQNEELQFRNRRLEDQLKALQAGGAAPGQPAAAQAMPPAAAPAAPAGYPPAAPAAAAPYGGAPQAAPARPQYGQQPAPIAQDQVAAPAVVQPAAPAPTGRSRGDAFDPNQNPNAPGVPRALGGGQLPMPSDASGAPIGRAAAPIDLNAPRGAAPAASALPTAPPTQSPKDEFDLGIGYMQRKDYALAEETMRSFTQKYPSDRMTGDAQYWLGESYYQRQRYREAAEAFLGVTTKYESSAKAPDALLRLGQSLAALKEKEAACAALGEVARKYPRASSSVKQAVDREQKRVKC
ncbi:tol-pal system protein YbgF [Rhodopseudomonas pseudopalustris]|uniref:tol-pal system protein YbgF n=1 Tax=Rhodopseudomonas pseudopalustris TaxID=1513892 RepID=UPI003F9E9CF1